MLRTPLCGLRGIGLPIVQSGTSRVAGPDLVAELCNAGGLGILAGLNVPAEDLRSQIRRIRAGQSNGLLRNVPGAAEVVRRIAAEAEGALERPLALGGARRP